MPGEQISFYDSSFETARRPNPVFCHQEFLEKLAAIRNLPVGKRASLLMQRLAVDERRLHYKSTRGVNQGWRRSRLGGNQGSHYYAWWAPRNAAPLKAGEGFREAPEGAIFLRDIRHHDDHSAAHAQSFGENYLPVSVLELRREEYGAAPWTSPQARFASARQPVRILKGHPGSGKTTALLNAADESGAPRVLYVTYSRDLAGLARDYFDRYCSKARYFYVVTFDDLIRQMLGADARPVSFGELRRRLRGDLVPFQRSLGPWTEHLPALYDEWHAHLVGAALPVAVGRFAASRLPRCDEKNYRSRRIRFLGESAVNAALDLAARLERSDSRSLADRYFSDLALAWQAAAALTDKTGPRIPAELMDFDCIAVDECQDLTPLEAFVLVELAAAVTRRRGRTAGMFLAGDEAQTVRPSDFEWGWMSDMLHYRLATPSEFKLASNLRSPRTIAQLVNRVWDLYGEVEKRDRPSGTGYAEIEDDSTDPMLYCTAAPGEELNALLTELAGREGVALVSLDENLTGTLPERARPSVLTASEVKGLDFHTVCVLNAGPQLDRILKWREDRYAVPADIESIRRRLAIDELRVALSRPADRLIWLDVSPSTRTVRTTLDFLNGDQAGAVSPAIPAALLTALAEEQLDVEERIQRCQADARQYLSVKPETAWSRAQQAVALLGMPSNPAAVADESVRQAAYLTLAEICFCLGFRDVHLAPELGRPDLFHEASLAAGRALRPGVSLLIDSIARIHRAARDDRLAALGDFVQQAVRQKEWLAGWLLAEIAPKIPTWMEELESAVTVGGNAAILPRILPPFYDAIRLPDAEARKQRLIERSIRLLMRSGRHADALAILTTLPQRQLPVEAECHEALKEYGKAAEVYRSLGMLKEALRCYRAVPDFESAVALIREMPDHSAAASYEWLIRLKRLLGERPENFNRVMTPAEKKILEQMLEQGLGVARKKPAPRKTAAKPKKGVTKRV